VERSSEASWSLAKGDYENALEQLNEAQRLTQAAAEALNREKRLSQKVLDTCLYMVRALLETGAEIRARSMTRDCRRLVPRGQPSELRHTPTVLEMLEEVDGARSEQTGSIRVKSNPPSCTVRLNGIVIGQTPLEVHNVFPGRYRVQVECDPRTRGRVHVADVVAGPTEVIVDQRFDDVVGTTPMLHLRYVDASTLTEHRVEDAERVSAVTPTSAVLLLSAPRSDAFELELYEDSPLKLRGLARIPNEPRGPSRGDIALAVRTLLEGGCTDYTGPQPSPLRCRAPAVEPAMEVSADDAWPFHRPPRARYIAGISLAGLGTASLLTGYVLMAPRASAGESWVDELDMSGGVGSPPQRWETPGTTVLVAAPVGGAALVAAMPLALPKRARTPWWAWASGAVGIGAVAASGYLASTVNDQGSPEVSCSSSSATAADARRCVKRGQRIDFAVLTGVAAAPLLTMPLVYLLRPKRMKLSANVRVSRAGGHVSVRGNF
jgi:hypothetical protein